MKKILAVIMLTFLLFAGLVRAEQVSILIECTTFDPCSYDPNTGIYTPADCDCDPNLGLCQLCKSLDGDFWSDPISPGGIPQYAEFRSGDGFLDISITGASWAGTVTLQRICIDETGVTSWCDVRQYTANTEKALIDQRDGALYRIGMKSADYVSGGPIRATLSNAMPN